MIRRCTPARVGLLAALVFGLGSRAADTVEPRVPVGKVLSPARSLLSRQSTTKDWELLGDKDVLHSRDLLLALPGTTAELEAQPRSVRVRLRGNLPELSDAPVLESAVVLHDSRAYALDFTLVRGRVVLTNDKEKGAAKVWVRLPGESWELTLDDPGASVAVEIYGRWPGGVPFSKEPREAPTSFVDLVVVKGSAQLKVGDTLHGLTAPPGRAGFRWDSVLGADGGPRRLDKVPEWADPKAESPVAKTVGTFAELFRTRTKDQPIDAVLMGLVEGADRQSAARAATAARQFGIAGLGAIGDVAGVADALANPRQADVREAAVLTLRHWIGATADRDAMLYRVLTDRLRYRPGQAETVLQLLHSPFNADLSETYETLITYLLHGQLAVRELARWHLYRLAPAGSSIAYDAGAAEDARVKATAEWKKLIPAGSLPPKPKEK